MKIPRSEKGQVGLLVVIIAVVLCGVLAGALSWARGMAPAQTTNQGIPMIVPQGANPEKDYANSQSNLNNAQANNFNAQANQHNAQATAVIVDAQGGYVLNAARATQIVADSNWGPINAYAYGATQQRANTLNSFLMMIAMGILVFVVAFVTFAKKG